MEDVNKIELKGHVTNVELKSFDKNLLGIVTVVTKYIYTTKGEAKIEETYHTVKAWRSKGVTCLSQLEKGQFVRVLGRYRRNRWVDDATGEQKISWEVVADTMRIIR